MTRSELRSYLPALEGPQLQRYLITNGWVNDGHLGNVATIWHRPDDKISDAELLLPARGIARDYDDRLLDLLATLAQFESREPVAVVTSITNLSVDLISIQVIHPDVEGGSIPLEDGVLLNEKAQDLVTSAALSALSRRRHFRGMRSPETNAYLGRLRLGQTQVGSYVINVIAPLSTQDTPQYPLEKRSFSRLVTNNLAHALKALHEGIMRYNEASDLSVFDSAIESGASANMCDALVGLSGTNHSRAFSVLISPSPLEPITEEIPFHYKFDVKSIAVMEQAANYFKDNYILHDQVIQGYVKRLDRAPGQETGMVSITAMLAGEAVKNVSVELTGSNYLDAIHAHESKLLVECRGDVHVSPRAARLLNPSGFRVFRNEELF